MPLYPTYNTSSPSAGNYNTINSVMATKPINIRDWLLVLNLVPKYPDALKKAPSTVRIGEPITELYNSTPVKLADIVGFGIAKKTEITFSNTFKADLQTPNTQTPYDILPYVAIQKFVDFGNVNTTDYKAWGQYPKYPDTTIDTYGLLSKTSVASYVNDNVFKNIYSDPSKQVDASPFITAEPPSLDPTKQIKGYIDDKGNLLFAGGGGGSNETANIIGSLVTGQGVGFTPNGVVSNYDVRSSLAGRVLGGAGGPFEDTKLGQIGGQQLLLALTNNAAFNVQESILGGLNLKENIYSLLKGKGFAGFRPSYKITIPKGGFTRVLDAAATILGFSLPRSYMDVDGSIFQSESGEVDNVTRANSLLLNTGKGQLFALLENVNANVNGTGDYDRPTNFEGSKNQFRSGYNPGYLKDNEDPDERIDSSIYAYSQEGLIINLFNTDDGSGKGNKYAIPTLNYDRKQIENSGFVDFVSKGIDNYEQADGTLTNYIKHSWVTKEGGLTNTYVEGWHATAGKNILPLDDVTSKNILRKTQILFDSNGMKTLVSREGDMTVTSNQTMTANGGGISKGSAVLSEDMYDKATGRYKAIKLEPEDVYCRAWMNTYRYDEGYKKIRSRALYTSDGEHSVPYRYYTENSVLEDSGHVKIVPYITDKIDSYKQDVKKFMFSIENLAWHDERNNLPKNEQGPGDLIGGKRGRIMWFPPYDINFSESSSVEWESNKFIGRGESIYTYNNTERSGQLSFKIVVDHSSYMNTFRGIDGPDDNYIASFMAGCIEPNSVWTDKFTLSENVENVTKEHREKVPKPPAEKEEEPTVMKVFFANDNATFEDNERGKFSGYELGKCQGVPIDYNTNPNGKDCGLNSYRGLYTSSSYWEDRNNFGLNNGGEDAVKVKLMDKEYKGYFSEVSGVTYYQALTEHLKQKCKHCKVTVVGYASDQGENTPNAKLAKDRATYIKELLIENVGKNLGISDADIQKRFKALLSKSKEIQPNSSQEITYEYKGQTKKVTVKVSPSGCYICPKTVKKAERRIACPVDNKGCKLDRFVDIEVKFDQAAADADVPDIPDKIKYQDQRITTTVRNKFYNESKFFEYLERGDRFVFDKIRDKIRYFHPSFHSTTPEGLNSRLTFLLQCTRQGPTLENKGADNLAFGRAPVCILRIGDFYHTKIIIDNISFDYEPLVWDLNPEGIGVQPMIANVNMSFKFIGGESLYGPISRLQNAVSFNFFANTHVYDKRADIIKNEGGEFSLEMGVREGYGESETTTTVEDIGDKYEKDENGNQIGGPFDDDYWGKPEEPDETQNDIDKLQSITMKIDNIEEKGYTGTGDRTLNGIYNLNITTSSELSKEYTARLVAYSFDNIPFGIGDVITVGKEGTSLSMNVTILFDTFFYNDAKEHVYRYELQFDDMDGFKTPGTFKANFRSKKL